MGMTNEEADKTLLELYHYFHGDVHFCGYNEENVSSSIDIARESIRKCYQIEQILDDCDLEAWEVLKMIKEVVEDGNE